MLLSNAVLNVTVDLETKYTPAPGTSRTWYILIYFSKLKRICRRIAHFPPTFPKTLPAPATHTYHQEHKAGEDTLLNLDACLDSSVSYFHKLNILKFTNRSEYVRKLHDHFSLKASILIYLLQSLKLFDFGGWVSPLWLSQEVPSTERG